MKMAPPDGFPYRWCSTYGEDEFGFWLEYSRNGIASRFRWILPGQYLMGSPDDEPHRYEHETQHEVALSKGFWLCDSACTQQFWESVTGSNPSNSVAPQKPVENVNWNDCRVFLERFNGQTDGFVLSLPTEAQWEYACRAGTDTPFSFGIDVTPEQVNFNGRHPYLGSRQLFNRAETVPVKSLPPNQWGLFEMHGNVWEWCADWFGDYSTGGVTDPTGPKAGTFRVLRGGSAFSGAADCRSAARSRFHPGKRYARHGFRCVLIPRDQAQQEELSMADENEWPEATTRAERNTNEQKAEMTMRNPVSPKADEYGKRTGGQNV